MPDLPDLTEAYKAAARAMHEVDCGCADWVPAAPGTAVYDEMATAAVDTVVPLIAEAQPTVIPAGDGQGDSQNHLA